MLRPDIHRVHKTIGNRFRAKRMTEFLDRFNVADDTTILDVGGTPATWLNLGVYPKVTLLNLTQPALPLPGNLTAVVGDGTALPYEDGAFDIVYSNSVIEHLYTVENQVQFAKEVQRVGKDFYVQTPNYWFPIEPHYLTPLVQYVPKRFRVRLLRNFTVWGLMTRPDKEKCRRFVDEIRLLKLWEIRRLFPEGTVGVERFLGMKKSFMVTRMIRYAEGVLSDREPSSITERVLFDRRGDL